VTGVSRFPALAVSQQSGTAGLTINGGAHGFAEFLFKHTSCFATGKPEVIDHERNTPQFSHLRLVGLDGDHGK
jgi:hypothetical protein